VKNALDFLDAPGRLARFLDRQVMRWFLVGETEPALGRRLLAGTSAVVYRLLGNIFGREFLGDMAAFFGLFKDLYEGFRARHEAVGRLFTSPGTAFLVVAAPREPSLDVARYFLAELVRRAMAVSGLVLGQVHVALPSTPGERAAAEAALDRELESRFPAVAGALGETLKEAHRGYRDLAEAEAQRIRRIEAELPRGAFVVRVPRMDAAIHDLAGLRSLHPHLLGESAERAPAARGPGYTPAPKESP
jgi:anion-transporting  ArsA/GET3 family ATPase